MTGPAAFEYNAHASDSAIEWMNWVRGFELFAKASKIEDDAEKCSSLLHYAGPKVQKIFFNLPPLTDEENKKGPLIGGYGFFNRSEYDEAIMKLDNFFAPKRNATYERHVFRQMKQEADERIEIYAMRLRTQAERCGFGEQLEGNIKDQITEGCTSSLLRRKILERGDDDFDAILKMAKVIEAVSEQQKTFDRPGDQPRTLEPAEEVNKIDYRAKANRSSENRNIIGGCSRCGYDSHKSADNKCPAMGKTCAKCGGKNHFARKCLTRSDRSNHDKRNVNQNTRPFNETKTNDVETKSEPPEKKEKQESEIRMIENNDYDDVFCVYTDDASNEVQCMIGGIGLKAIIDSGSRYNIMDRGTWNQLKGANVKTISRQKKTEKVFRAYGGQKLTMIGVFEAVIKVNGREVIASVYVVNEGAKFLLGRDTAMALKVLKIGEDIDQVLEDKATRQFSKMKGIVVEIPLKENVKPVAQPYRRIPAPLQLKVDTKIDELLAQGIIEKVNGPSKWISPMVPVPKQNDIRICIDMRQANQAVERENYPLPTIEDFLPRLGKAKFFSRLDIKQAFHQVEE